MSNTVKTMNAYFDLYEFVESVRAVDVASQMAQSVAFAIDVQLSNAARQLLKNVRKDYANLGYESLAEMTLALEDSATAEEAMHAAGKDDLGPVATIQMLHLVRENWHNLAADLTRMCFDWQGQPRNYEVRPIEEFLTREVKLQVKPQTKARIQTIVQRRAGSASDADIAAVVEKRMRREERKLEDISNTLTSQQGAIISMYNAALLWGDEQHSTEFHALHADIRRALISAALKGAERAEDFAASSSSITDAEFDDISFAVLEVERQLKAVMAGVPVEVKRVAEV